MRQMYMPVWNTFAVVVLLVGAAAGVSGQTLGDDLFSQKVDPRLYAALEQQALVEVLVIFKEQADLQAAAHLPGKMAKGTYVFRQLQVKAEKSQAGVSAWLQREAIAFRPLYIINALYIPEANRHLLENLAQRPEVSQIVENSRLIVPEVQVEQALNLRQAIEWGVQKIQAPAVWAMGYTGQGVVVGGQDTGYDWTHPAIRKKYRGWIRDTLATHAYNWFDAIKSFSPLHSEAVNPCGLKSAAPCDDNGHGTHTMGTMVGDDGQGNQIGVAPGATWIGCRNMDRGYGSPFTYLECFQWFLAPTDIDGKTPNPGLAPDIINNSWGCPDIEGCNPTNIPLLETAVNNLRAAGVFIAISAGNEGPSCASIQDPPSIFPAGFAVGATNSADTIARFSSRGPVVYQGKAKTYIKPDVVAPGVAVRSAVRNQGYALLSGTSMAGPHVAGAVALLLSANPRLRGEVAQLEYLLRSTAHPLVTAETCGGISGDSIPNATYGNGRINLLAAVEAARNLTTSTESNPTQGGLRIFPNPAQNMITLETGIFEGNGQFSLWDISGRLQHYQEVRSWGDPLITLELPGLSSGIYMFRWQTTQGAYSGKLVIQQKD